MFSKTVLVSILPALAVAAPSCPAPAPPSNPPSTPPSGPSCGSLTPKWTLDGINTFTYYTYTSPSASGPKLGQISFDFKNDQVDYTTACKGSSVNPQGIFYGSTFFDCEGGEPAKKTSFSFDTATSVIIVNSTWICPGGDVVYNTQGSGTADLACTTNTWNNPDWQAGELYSNTTTACGPSTLTIQP